MLRRPVSLPRLRPDIRKFNNHVVSQHTDRYFSEASPRVPGMNAGANIELVTVPGADYVHLGLREHHALAGTVLGDYLLDLGDHLTLAGRSARMRTLVKVSKKLPVQFKYADLEVLEGDDLATRICELRRRTDFHVTH